MRAVRSESVATCKALLEAGADPNMSAEGGHTPLKLAASYQNREIMALLLDDLRTDPNFVWTDYRDCSTALYEAVRLNDVAVASLLLQHPRIDVNKNNFFDTPLHCAVNFGAIDALKLLLADKRVDPCIANRRGKTPLQCAEEQSFAVAKALLQDGRPCMRKSSRGNYSDVLEAIAAGDWDWIDDLLTDSDEENLNVDLDASDDQEMTVMHHAIHTHHLEVLKKLAARSEVDVNARDQSGQTPLFHAVAEQSVEAVRILLANERTDVNIESNDWISPLRKAAGLCHVDIVRQLLAHPKIFVEQPRVCLGNDGLSTLEFAVTSFSGKMYKSLASHDRIETAGLLLNQAETKPDHARASWAGLLFPLYSCAREDNRELCRMLCANPRVRINQGTSDGWTALTMSAAENVGTFMYLLSQPGIDPNLGTVFGHTPLYTCASAGNIDAVQALLKADSIQLGTVLRKLEDDAYSSTALHAAAQNGRAQVLRALLETRKISVDERLLNGRTALMEASRSGHVDAVKAVLEFSPDLDLKDENEFTAYMLAAKHGKIDITKVLLTEEKKREAERNAKEKESLLARVQELERERERNQQHFQYQEELQMLRRKSLMKSRLEESMDYLRRFPKLWAFYFELDLQLKSLFGAYFPLNSGRFMRAKVTSEAVMSKLTLLGEAVPVPGASIFLTALDEAWSSRVDATQKQVWNFMCKLLTQHELPPPALAAEVARLTTFKFEPQILQLEGEQVAETFADCVLRRYVTVIEQSSSTRSWENPDCLCAHFLHLLCVESQRLASKLRFTQVKLPLQSHQQSPQQQQQQRQAQQARFWYDADVLSKTGVCTLDGRLFAPDSAASEVLGFRLGSAAEVHALGLQPAPPTTAVATQAIGFWTQHALHANPFLLLSKMKALVMPPAELDGLLLHSSPPPALALDQKRGSGAADRPNSSGSSKSQRQSSARDAPAPARSPAKSRSKSSNSTRSKACTLL
eukprot:m.322761 g.322761  ORF g.322761 m.322761 type:complete len:977 (-) comp27571_c0_seq1:101-3031(-)